MTGTETNNASGRHAGDGWFSARLSDDDVAELAQNLAALSAAGLPLDDGLAALAEELPRGRLRQVLREMSSRLARGDPLDEVVAAQTGHLPAHVRGMVLAGVRSGRLAETLQQYVNHQQLVAELRRRVWSAMAYPLLMLGFALVVSVMLQLTVVNHFESIFAEFDMNLPWMTIVTLQASKGIVWVACGAAIALLTLWIVARMTLGGPLRRRLICRIPLFGPLWRFSALARFSHLAALLLESGIPWATTLRWSADAAGDVDLADTCYRIAGEVETGQVLAGRRICQTRLPAGLGPLLAWGESRNALPEALFTAAEMYEGRAQVHSSFVVVVAPALAMVLAIAIVGFVAMSIVIPLISLIEALSF